LELVFLKNVSRLVEGGSVAGPPKRWGGGDEPSPAEVGTFGKKVGVKGTQNYTGPK